MPQVCGVESLFPSESLYPSDTLAPGSGSIFVPTLPLPPADFPIDDSAAIFAAADDPISLGRFYPGRLFNDLPEYFQGLPLQQLQNVEPLPDYEDDPDNLEARWWGIQRILLRAFGRELARVDYILRGRVSLADFAASPRLPHATSPDDENVFELTFEEAFVIAESSFVNPGTVKFSQQVLTTTRLITGDTTVASPILTNLTTTLGLVPGTPVSGAGIPVGAAVLTVDSGTQVTLDDDATATASGVSLTFTFTRVIPIQYRTNRATVQTEATGAAGTRYVFARRINDQQEIEAIGYTGGTIRLGHFGDYTNPIDPATATGADIQRELEGLDGIEPGDVLVTGAAAGPWPVFFQGGLSGTDVRQLDIDVTALVGVGAEATVTTVQDGSSGYSLILGLTTTPPDADCQIIGEVQFDGTEVTAATTYTERVGEPANGEAYYDPFLDPLADNGVNPACAPLSQNEGLPAQFFAATANWGLDLWENMFGLEVPSKNPVNTIQYPERRARILRAALATRASTAAEFSYLAAARARELGITIGEFEEAQYTDPGWEDPEYVVALINDSQYWRLDNATAGTYLIDVLGVTVGPIAWNASDGTVQAAFDAALGVGNTFVQSFTGVSGVDALPHGTFYGVEFIGTYEGVGVDDMVFDTSGLTGLTPTVTVNTLQNGAPGLNEVKTVTLANVIAGSFPLQLGSEVSTSIQYAATADEVKGALTPFLAIADDDLIVEGPNGGPWQLEFVENLAETDIGPLTCPDTSLLVGVPATISSGHRHVDVPQDTLWRGGIASTFADEYVLHGAPAESTYPWWIWATVYAIEDLDTDPQGAKVRVMTLRQYIEDMAPAHLAVGFDWGPIGGFIVDISIVGRDRV